MCLAVPLKLIEITGKALSGEWGTDDENGNGIPVLRTTNFTNEGVVNYDNVVTRIIAAPGVWMQHITTKEPDDKMIEVAIAAMKDVIPENGEDRIG